MRFLIAFLALAGSVVAGLALHVHYSTETEACSINEKWDCGIVNHSPFAVIGPVPVAAIGIGGYLVLAGLALVKRRRLLVTLACVALVFGLRLTYIEKYILEVYCLYCVISFALTILITLLSIGWVLVEARSRRRSTV
jgi:vitamin-K-epoxide reductase (warfarin-sensitive)